MERLPIPSCKQNLCRLHKPLFYGSGTDGYGCLRMRHADRRANTSCIIDALCGNFNARVRAPQGCERAGLDWSVLSSASARQASKITFASAKGRPSISRECSGKTDQASPQGAADKDRLRSSVAPRNPRRIPQWKLSH